MHLTFKIESKLLFSDEYQNNNNDNYINNKVQNNYNKGKINNTTSSRILNNKNRAKNNILLDKLINLLAENKKDNSQNINI